MDAGNCGLTVLFEKPFWAGVFERIEGGKLSVSKVTFGAEPKDYEKMWYRFSRRADDYRIECSQDGVHFTQMRICHMWEGSQKIAFGIYACSPEDSSFTAAFSDMKITECAWPAHDGQAPDMA